MIPNCIGVLFETYIVNEILCMETVPKYKQYTNNLFYMFEKFKNMSEGFIGGLLPDGSEELDCLAVGEDSRF